MYKTIGILAHVDAGKTTFAEQLLYHTNSIRSRGRVDHKNSFLDCHSIERERGITIFSDQGIFEYNNSTYYLIDTPGHIDFSQEMERTINILDYAVIIVSAVDGVQAHTEKVFTLLKKYNIPTLFFINKTDRENADINKVFDEISLKLTKNNSFVLDDNFDENKISEDLIEFIADKDEKLLERYLEGNYNKELWIQSIKNMIKNRVIFPVFKGSALYDDGIDEFLYKLDIITYTNYIKEENFSGRIYKVRYDDKGKRITYIKALKGKLKVKDDLSYGDKSNDFCEKINEIRIYNGEKFKTVDEVSAGEVFAAVGISKGLAGDGVGTLKDRVNFNTTPTLKSKVIFGKEVNYKDVLKYFKILEEEDPTLNVVWDEYHKEININIMGTIQLEVLKKILEDRFKVIIEFGPCEILYKETINESVLGYGHFEPLGHYGEVALKIEPGDRNSGISFESKCHVDNLDIGSQNLVKTHIFEKDHKGILTGSPITDLKITLLDGRYHKKHTSGGDFREATYRALRQGLEKVKNKLLEPYYNFKIEVQSDYIGRVLSDIQKLNGTFNPPQINENNCIVIGRGPVATFMNYSVELISFTKGKGIITLNFDGYEYCHNESEIIERFNYDKNKDSEYTSKSIFCSKGQSYTVDADKVEDYIHCLRK